MMYLLLIFLVYFDDEIKILGLPFPITGMALCCVALIYFQLLLFNNEFGDTLLSYRFRFSVAGSLYFIILMLMVSSILLIHQIDGFFSPIDLARMVLSIIIGFIIFIIGSYEASNNRIPNIIAVLTIILIACSIESFTSFGPSLQNYYAHLHNLSDLKNSLHRDIGLVGHLRPIFFSTEPSNVAKLINLLVAMELMRCISINNKPSIYLLPLILVLSYVIGSPIVLGSFVLIFVYHLFYSSNRYRYYVGSLALLVFICAFYYFGNRFADLETHSYSESSDAIRLIVGFLVAKDVLNSNYWLFGMGLNADKFVSGYSSIAHSLPQYAVLGNNSFARIFIMFGISGLIIIIFLYYFLKRFFSNKNGLFFVSVYASILGFSTGSISAFLFWHSMFLVLSISSVQNKMFSYPSIFYQKNYTNTR